MPFSCIFFLYIHTSTTILPLALLAPKLAQDALVNASQAQQVPPRNRILPAHTDITKTYGKHTESAQRGYQGWKDRYLGMVMVWTHKLYLVKVR